jgi:hypothetical protein
MNDDKVYIERGARLNMPTKKRVTNARYLPNENINIQG